ncbi:MAG: nucleotidyl transferase AbiEii/AbiGii toxin family protein [Thermoanaerobaculia bacterium]
MSIFEPILARLNEEGGRYVVVGGLAVVLHGHARLTVDLDLVVDLAPQSARRTIAVLIALGFRPLAPVDAFEFADGAKRRQWIDEKGMRVFSLYHPDQALRSVDLFVESPVDFEELWRDSELVPLRSTAVHVASIPHLIRMKELAGRSQDREDIERLAEIQRRKGRPRDE